MLKKMKFTWLFSGLVLLNTKEKRIMLCLGVVITISGLIETMAFGSVIPFIAFILEPEKIEANKYYQYVFSYLSEPSRDIVTYYWSAFSLFLLIFANSLVIFMNLIISKFSASCWRRVSHDLMKECIQTPYEWFISKNSAVVTRLFYNDIAMWSRDSIYLILSIFNDVIVFIFLGILVLKIFPNEGIWAIIISFLLGSCVMILCVPKIKKYANISRKTHDKTIVSTNQIFTGIKDIKISSSKKNFINFFDDAIAESAYALVWARFWKKLYPSVFVLIVQSGLVLIALFLWSSGLSGTQIALFIALAIMISSRVIPSINRIMGSLGGLINIHPFVIGILNFKKELNDLQTNISETKDEIRPFKNWTSVKFNKVNFNYQNSNKKIIKNLNIEFKKGKIYGIVGASGSGKTTIIDLLLGLLSKTSGQIKVDNLNVDKTNVMDWIKEVGYVSQFPFLIDGTLKDNIAFSLDHKLINNQKIKQCIENSQLNELVKDLEFGENSSIGERGLKISGGQKQRIAIARALYKDPSLLILDEATNALDSINEQRIMNVIKSLKPNITTIMVTHKVFNLKEADKIIMLKDGDVQDYGTFDYLIKNSLEFRKLTSIELR